MDYEIRATKSDEIDIALDLALKVFAQFEMPEYEEEALENFKCDCICNDEFKNRYRLGENIMLVAYNGDKILGMICERGNGHIAMLFVDGEHHRRGIATSLMHQMKEMLKDKGIKIITLNSSPYGLSFYKHFGFVATDDEQRKNGFVFTPMKYII
jgi:ribosomal protein S18 acetylase RimI-like enzyme